MRLLTLLVCFLIAYPVQADNFSSFRQSNTQTEVECLTEALYFEGAVDGRLGMYLVANVIANRVYDSVYEFRSLSSWCDVVHQPSNNPARPWECAFSYYCDSKPEVVPDIPNEQLAAIEAREIAYEIINKSPYGIDFTEGALYYTQSQVSRGWMKNTIVTVTYLHHVFRKPIPKLDNKED